MKQMEFLHFIESRQRFWFSYLPNSESHECENRSVKWRFSGKSMKIPHCLRDWPTLLFSLSKCCCNSVLFKKDNKLKCKRQMGGYLNEYLSGGSDEYFFVSSLLSYHNNWLLFLFSQNLYLKERVSMNRLMHLLWTASIFL